jgi:hypothetical protein
MVDGTVSPESLDEHDVARFDENQALRLDNLRPTSHDLRYEHDQSEADMNLMRRANHRDGLRKFVQVSHRGGPSNEANRYPDDRTQKSNLVSAEQIKLAFWRISLTTQFYTAT